MTKALKWTLLAGTATFLFLAGAALYVAASAPEAKPLEKPLAELIAATIPPWRSETVEMAETPEMRSRVEGILKFDDALCRIYRNGVDNLNLYAAYWGRGKIPIQDVSVHTPDTCWLFTGWTRDFKEVKEGMKIGGRTLKPFEYGAYTKDGQTLYVAFWHLVGEQTNRFEDQLGWRNGIIGRLERLPNIVKTFKRFGLHQQHEQFFVRISSSTPLLDLWETPDFQALMETLEPLRIFENPNPDFSQRP